MKRLIFLLCAMFLLACQPDFKQISYFKSEHNFRVFVYVVPDGTTKDALKEHARKQMYTAGSTTAVYYYSESTIGSLNHDVTTAPDAFVAQTLACTEGCVAGYWKFPTGKESFIENPCKETQ